MDRRATFAPQHANHSRPPVCVPCVLLLLALQAFIFSSAPGLCHWRSQDGAAHSKRCKRSTALAMEEYILGCLTPHGWAPQMQERAMLSPISIPGGRKSPAPVSTHLLHLQSVSSTRPLTTIPAAGEVSALLHCWCCHCRASAWRYLIQAALSTFLPLDSNQALHTSCALAHSTTTQPSRPLTATWQPT